MRAIVAVAPATAETALPLIVTIAVAVIALVVVGALVITLQRLMHPTVRTVAFSVGVVVVVIVGALLVGGSLTQPPAAGTAILGLWMPAAAAN